MCPVAFGNAAFQNEISRARRGTKSGPNPLVASGPEVAFVRGQARLGAWASHMDTHRLPRTLPYLSAVQTTARRIRP
jgi:hypothetical protein